MQGLLELLEREINEVLAKGSQPAFVARERFEMVQVTLLNPPEWCRCPLTCTVLRDPVLVSGSPFHPTVERRVIEGYFETGKYVCPVSGKPVKDQTLIPDTKLQQGISWWKKGTGWKDQALVRLGFMPETCLTHHFCQVCLQERAFQELLSFLLKLKLQYNASVLEGVVLLV